MNHNYDDPKQIQKLEANIRMKSDKKDFEPDPAGSQEQMEVPTGILG